MIPIRSGQPLPALHEISSNRPPFSAKPMPATLNDTLHSHNGLASNWAYRQFMQKNGTQIMKQDTMLYYQSTGLSPYTFSQTAHPVVSAPLYTTSLQDQAVIAKSPFPESDMKRAYLEKVRFEARKVAPVLWVNEAPNSHYEKRFARAPNVSTR